MSVLPFIPRRRVRKAWPLPLSVLGAAFLLSPAASALHEQGNVTLSLSGSLAHTQNYRRETLIEYEWDGQRLREIESRQEDRYDNVDLCLYASGGYFVANRLELGVLLSGTGTMYSGTNRDDFSVYDTKLYAKRYFDNRTPYTPYLKLQGGASRLRTGSYNETDSIVGVVAGLEVFGMGSVMWFAELASEYTFLGGDLHGTAWKNRLYLGITWYLNPLKRKPAAPAAAAYAAPPNPPAGETEALDPATMRLIERTERKYRRALEKLEEEIEQDLRQTRQ